VRRLRSALAWLERASTTRRGAALLFGVALAVYAVQSLAIPLVAGRDLGTYLRYYAQYFDGHPVLPMAMLFRTPVAPFAVGLPLDVGGAALAQVWLGVLYAGSVVAWSGAAAVFGGRAALATAVALLAYPGYGILFHALSSDAIFAAAFAAWALVVARAAVRMSVVYFAAAGFGVGVLALIRPGNQVLLVFAAFPLLLPASWRVRGLCAAAFLAAGVATLGAWALHNGVRYGDYTVARGGAAFVPFFRMYVTDHIVEPANGPESRRLADAVDRYLLHEEPYRSYRVTRAAFFRYGGIRTHEDLVNLSDRVWGWDSNYGQLRDVAWEALRAHPGPYAEGVARTVWQELSQAQFAASASQAAAGTAAASASAPEAPPGLEQPSDGELIPAARRGLYTTTPDGSVDERWTSATDHELVFARAGDAERYADLDRRVRGWLAALPAYDTSSTLRLYLNRASRWYPRPWMLLLVGLVAVALRRPRRSSIALALAGAGVAVVVFTALGIFTVLEYALPVAPAFVLLAAAGLFGSRPVDMRAQPC
jgi:hypothetical protein